MSRLLHVSLYVNYTSWDKFKNDARFQPGESTVEGTLGLEMGALNEFQGTLVQLRSHIRELTQQAQKAKEWQVVSVMARLIAECEQMGIYHYIVVKNV